MINELRLPWFLGSECNFFLANEGIDEGGLANVGSTENGEFGSVISGAILGATAALDELYVLDSGVAGVGSDGDVGAR